MSRNSNSSTDFSVELERVKTVLDEVASYLIDVKGQIEVLSNQSSSNDIGIIRQQLDTIPDKIDSLNDAIMKGQSIFKNGITFKSKEDFTNYIIRIGEQVENYRVQLYQQQKEEYHKNGEFTNRELLLQVLKTLDDFTRTIKNSLKENSKNSRKRESRWDRFWYSCKTKIYHIFYEPSNKWYRNVYAWLSIFLFIFFFSFTIIEVITVNRLKKSYQQLKTIADQHTVTKAIISELTPDLFVTIDSYDELVNKNGIESALQQFKKAQEQTKKEE